MMFLSHFKHARTVRTRLMRRSAQWMVITLLLTMLGGAFTAPAAAAPLQVESARLQISPTKLPSINTCAATTLRPGSRGSCVSVLQQRLLDRGYALGVKAPTGAYLTMTKAAVEKFQRDNKLKADAIVGPVTWKKLGATSPKPAPSNAKPVTLTFDDCPASKTSANQTLRAAKDMGMHLRLYVNGDCINTKKRFDVAAARKLGHTVCTHSNNHLDLTRLNKAQIRKELTTAGLSTNCGRPPYGAVNANVRAVFAEKKLSLDLWDVDTNDWRGKTQAQVVNWTIQHSRPGDVVLMHFQHKGFTPAALRQIKDGLAKRGLSVK